MKRGTTSVKAARGRRSVDEGASGERELPMRCKDAKEEGGKKAVKGRRVKKEAGIWSGDVRVPKDAVATGRKVGKVRPVKNLSKLKAAEANKPAPASAAPGDVTLEAAGTATKEGGVRLSQDYIDFVMSWKPKVYEDPDELYARLIKYPDCFPLDLVESTTKLQRDLIEESKECAASVEGFHNWVKAEYMEKGYVEVDDDYIARRIELQQSLEEDELYALAFGPMDGVVAEGEEDKFALASGPMDAVN